MDAVQTVLQGGGRVVDWIDEKAGKLLLGLPYGEVARGYLAIRRGERGATLQLVGGLGGTLAFTGGLGFLALKVQKWRDKRYVDRIYYADPNRPLSKKAKNREVAIRAARCVSDDRDDTLCREIFSRVQLDSLKKNSIHELARECNDHDDDIKKIHQLCGKVGERLSGLYEKEIKSHSLFEKIPEELWRGLRVYQRMENLGPGKWGTKYLGCYATSDTGRCHLISSYARSWINRVRTKNYLPRIQPDEYVKLTLVSQ